ncbi:hypothetical protein V1511DRAFT_504067 [Dipodascopsis uninucleata]
MKQLLLIHVHGFKGTVNTFRDYHLHLQQNVQTQYPLDELRVVSMVYPQYETKGEIDTAVNDLQKYIETAVIDAEVALGTESPVVTPGVAVILVAHSMGGLVSADVIAKTLAGDKRYMFPTIIGALCFDSPFLGLHTSVFAQDVVQRGAAKFKELRNAGSSLPIAAAATSAASFLFAKKSNEQPSRQIEATNGASGHSEIKSIESNRVQTNSRTWMKYAGIAAAGIATTAVATAGTVWYLKGQNIDGKWAKDHMVFVSALFQKESILKERLWKIYEARDRVQLINYYTVITHGGDEHANTDGSDKIIKGLGKLVSGDIEGKRTFCNVPKDPPYSDMYIPTENSKATGEIEAHINMFEEDKNPGYRQLLSDSSERVFEWTRIWLERKIIE